MNKLELLKTAVTSRAGRQLLHLKKHAPVLLFAAGVVGVTTTVVLACKATMKLEPILTGLEEDLENLENGAGYVEVGGQRMDDRKAKALLYTKAAINVGRLYAPSVVLGALSITALTGSHVILTQRNTALVAVAATTQRALDKYRQRVREQLGEEQDQKFLYGEVEKEVVEETGEGLVTRTIKTVDQKDLHLYDKFFDELNPNYERGAGAAERNAFFIRCAQNWANDKLRIQGHLFLNDVYGMLGLPLTEAGQVMGWINTKEKDSFVDFGIFDHRNEGARRFLNGYEDAVRLHFNVDGPIMSLIGKKR